MPEIPPEARALIADFKKSEAERQAGRPSKTPSKRILNRSKEYRGQMTAGEIISLARQRGFSVTSGNGRHGMHLIAPDGWECSLPVHGGKTLHTGTQRQILNGFEEHGVSTN